MRERVAVLSEGKYIWGISNEYETILHGNIACTVSKLRVDI